MRIAQSKPLSQCETPAEALEELCAPFSGTVDCQGGYSLAMPGEMPEPYRRLLVHQKHMTLVLQTYHDAPAQLYVMQVRHDREYYSRKIFLTKGFTAPAIELGVVRINLQCVREAARQEILEARTPLGAVLVKHNLLLRIEPRWYLRFEPGSSILNWFGYEHEGPFFGRIGTIFCGEEPAIELLEIATLWGKQETP